jgi:hypothetical protein
MLQEKHGIKNHSNISFFFEIIFVLIVVLLITYQLLTVPKVNKTLENTLPPDFTFIVKRSYFPNIENFKDLPNLSDYKLIKDQVSLSWSKEDQNKIAYQQVGETKYNSYFNSELLQEIITYKASVNQAVKQKISITDRDKVRNIITCLNETVNFNTWLPLGNLKFSEMFDAKPIFPFQLYLQNLVNQKMSSEYAQFLSSKLVTLSEECINNGSELWSSLVDSHRMIICVQNQSINWIFYKNYLGVVTKWTDFADDESITVPENPICPLNHLILNSTIKENSNF